MSDEKESVCKLCGKPKAEWQVFCGATCSVAWEMGIRTREAYEDFLKERDEHTTRESG
jgi:hypothetical protein